MTQAEIQRLIDDHEREENGEFDHEYSELEKEDDLILVDSQLFNFYRDAFLFRGLNWN